MTITSQTMTVEYTNPVDFGEHYKLVSSVGWILVDLDYKKSNGSIVSLRAYYQLDIPDKEVGNE